MASLGAKVRFCVPELPFRGASLEDVGIEIVVSKCKSDAYPASDFVIYGAISEELAKSATTWLEAGHNNKVILFATYLFPFCAAAELAARMLSRFKGRVRYIINPAGSDIWQIGRQMQNVARELIDSRHVTDVVTYSKRFSEEIRVITGSERRIEIIPPSIDTSKFRPMTLEYRLLARQKMNITDDTFVISHCSNNRPVKGIVHSIDIARQFVSATNSDTRLLIVGPITQHLRDAFELLGLPSPNDDLPHDVKIGKLHITCVGLQREVMHYHVLSDVALNTSLHDSFNISLAEAMACEVPVLTSDVAGIASIIEDYACGYVVPFDFNPIYDNNAASASEPSVMHYDSAVCWLVEILRNREKRIAMGKRARAAIIEQCSDQVVANMWGKLLGFSPFRGRQHSNAIAMEQRNGEKDQTEVAGFGLSFLSKSGVPSSLGLNDSLQSG